MKWYAHGITKCWENIISSRPQEEDMKRKEKLSETHMACTKSNKSAILYFPKFTKVYVYMKLLVIVKLICIVFVILTFEVLTWYIDLYSCGS